MTPSPTDIDTAINRWLLALSRAQTCRSSSALLVVLAELGIAAHGGKPGTPPPTGLVRAQRAVRLCTAPERKLLVLRYWDSPRTVVVSKASAGGSVEESRGTVLQSLTDCAKKLGIRRSEAEAMLAGARRHVAAALDG